MALLHGFLFRSEFFFRTTRELEYLFFLCRAQREICFQNSTLGYMTKTLNQIIFFPSTKIRIFCSATLGIRIYFQKKNITSPFKLNGRSLTHIVFFVFFLFVLCLVFPIIHVSLHCSFLIVASVFSNVYFVAMSYSFTTIIRWNRHRSEKFDRKAQNKIYTPCPIYIFITIRLCDHFHY